MKTSTKGLLTATVFASSFASAASLDSANPFTATVLASPQHQFNDAADNEKGEPAGAALPEAKCGSYEESKDKPRAQRYTSGKVRLDHRGKPREGYQENPPSHDGAAIMP